MEDTKHMLTVRKSEVTVAWLICSAAMAHAQTPTIVSAIVNSPVGQITIVGSNLAPAIGAPVVQLDLITLTLVLFSSAQIVADLPAELASGTYQLTVSNGSATAGVFDVSNGVVGPQGPAGPAGTRGPAGPQGPSGSLKLPLTGSAAGSSDPVFQITNTSAAHSAMSGHGGGGSVGYNGGTGTSGYGGASNGTSSLKTYGGDGVYALGGTGAGEYDSGGPGVSAYGGPGNGSGADGGTGVFASGGNSSNLGGAGVVAYGGNGGGEGIYAQPGSGADAYAGYFSGDVWVIGTLSKPGGSFKIDHPLDPANKYLYHSFVESPDMMNIYNGNVVTDGSGTAIVTMPSWFEALNADFRYQLTVIGQFAQAIVAAEIANRSFIIKTSKPGVKVSWQVTGIRQDAWANAHRIPVEVDKAPKDQGHYIHPELFGHEGEPSIAEIRHPRPQPPQQ
jgi:trimeric autotransporter adhesin